MPGNALAYGRAPGGRRTDEKAPVPAIRAVTPPGVFAATPLSSNRRASVRAYRLQALNATGWGRVTELNRTQFVRGFVGASC